jgi:sugar-specific transcriptional regulator TrmB
MGEEEITKKLRDFGLQKNEVEVYLFLARTGKSSVGIIARRLGTNRMNIYRTLKTLEEKRLIESTIERPLKFLALPIVRFLDEDIENARKNISALEKSKEKIVDYCQHLLKPEEPVEESKFRIVQGRKHVLDQISRMLEKVEKETCIIQTGNGLYRFVYGGIDDKLKALHRRGVNMMILSVVDDSSIKAIESFLDFAEIRHMTTPPTFRMVLIDEVEALTTFTHDDSMSLTTGNELAMWVRAPDYAKSMKVFFQTLWSSSTSARRRIETITTMKTLRKGLESAKTVLDMKGWTTSVPGKLIGESGVEHSFDMVAKHEGKKGMLVVLDLPSAQGSLQTLAFDLKALDTKPAVRILVTEKPPSEQESELANHHGISLIQADNSRRLAVKITDEANRIIGFQKGKTAGVQTGSR